MDIRILIVDDLESEAFRISSILKKAGYLCKTATNGAEAVEHAKSDHPDLILMDVVMGSEDGFQACRRIKKEASTADIPIVFVTSKSDDNARWWAERIGATAFLVKPVPADLLLETVKRALPSARVQ